MSRILSFVALLLFTTCNGALAQTKAAPPVTAPASGGALNLERFEGGSMVVPLSSSIKLNERSTLKREWFVVSDDASPARFTDKTGIDVGYKQERSIGNYRYTAYWQVKVKEPITAIDVRYVVLDVFGRVLHTLTGTEVEDAADTLSHNGEWRIYSENEASEAFTSIAYVASCAPRPGGCTRLTARRSSIRSRRSANG